MTLTLALLIGIIAGLRAMMAPAAVALAAGVGDGVVLSVLQEAGRQLGMGRPCSASCARMAWSDA